MMSNKRVITFLPAKQIRGNTLSLSLKCIKALKGETYPVLPQGAELGPRGKNAEESGGHHRHWAGQPLRRGGRDHLNLRRGAGQHIVASPLHPQYPPLNSPGVFQPGGDNVIATPGQQPQDKSCVFHWCFKVCSTNLNRLLGCI